MPPFKNLGEVNARLKASGFKFNPFGGEIKGDPDVHLAQSSTIADKIEVQFSDTKKVSPSCFYEFAQRYPMT